jgi:hypothetical protein
VFSLYIRMSRIPLAIRMLLDEALKALLFRAASWGWEGDWIAQRVVTRKETKLVRPRHIKRGEIAVLRLPPFHSIVLAKRFRPGYASPPRSK